ncbi:hypothetical protein Trebr_0792 [Treponema brennaborense DSM 12168]|uniref:Tetratricopeptide repeat protein n=2 Tax=Treponema TaxID=157 RepID=F4LIQ3_TREBD|nr:hypothetical protein Trebr_0792 [Treponema brennaborense DSM 12168]
MKIRYAGYVCTLCCMLVCFSCRMSSKEQAFTAKLDEIDVAVSIGDTSAAVALLDKLAKQPAGAFQRLGVYRRYMTLGQTAAAEKYLRAGLEKLPENPELTAVYVWFLYGQGRSAEALEAARPLQQTQYAALLSELTVRNAAGGAALTDPGFIRIYTDAYAASKNDLWLQNAAVIEAAASGAVAVSAFPPEQTCTMPLFWAYAAYDAGRYSQALAYANTAAAREGDDSLEARLLAADIFTASGDDAAAESARAAIIARKGAPAALYFNSARYARLTGDTVREYELLNELTSLYPDYVPGLDAYADFALRSAAVPPEDALARAVRAAGMQSAGMKAYDAVPRISSASVISRMDAALERSRDPLLAAIRYRYAFDSALDTSADLQKKIAELWLLLERWTDAGGAVNGTLVSYAVPLLLSFGEEADARRLFDTYLLRRYGSSVYADILSELSAAECGYAAYFCATGAGEGPDIPAAQYIYQYLAENMKESYPELAEKNAYEPSPDVLVNLAELYAGTRKYDAAKRLYGTAAGKTADTQLKAEILYRLADTQFASGDKRAALISADYCLSLNSSHAGARILRKRLAADR